MTDWASLGTVSQFAPGSATRTAVNGVAVAVVHTVDGDIFAVSDTCTHADVSLSEGEVDDCAIECWLHGSRFDLRTGAPSGPPATAPLQTYEVSLSTDSDPIVSVRVRT